MSFLCEEETFIEDKPLRNNRSGVLKQHRKHLDWGSTQSSSAAGELLTYARHLLSVLGLFKSLRISVFFMLHAFLYVRITSYKKN